MRIKAFRRAKNRVWEARSFVCGLGSVGVGRAPAFPGKWARKKAEPVSPA